MHKDSLEQQAKQEYDILLENEELLEMFSNFTGSWKKDKAEFMRFYEMNEEILKTDKGFDLEEGFEGVYEE